MTVGPRGSHYSVHSSGRRTRTVGLPGTGLYYQSVTGRGGQTQRSSGTRAQAPARPRTIAEAIPRPGLFASHAENAYHAGVLAQVASDAPTALARFEEVVAADPTIASAQVLAGFAANAVGDGARAIAHFEAVVQGGRPLPDKYEVKYLDAPGVELTLGVGITHSVMAHPPLSVLAAALALAELYQVTGRLSEAIGIMQQVHTSVPDPVVRLSLCDLLFADHDYEGVVEASVGVVNDADVEAETLHLRAAAFDALGDGTAAIDAFRAALAKTAGRSPGLVTAIRYDRGLAYQRLGQRAKAKADFERVYAADPAFEDVKERLAATSSPPTP